MKLALDGNNDEPGETLILSEITDGGQRAVWTGESDLTYNPGNGPVTTSVQTRATLTGVNLAFVESATAGFVSTQAPQAVSVVTDDFDANLLLEAQHPQTAVFTPVQELLDSLTLAGDTGMASFFSAGFFDDDFVLPGDYNGDCSVSYGDYDVVNARWLDNTCSEVNDWYDGADANMSGTVDAEDLLALALLWLDTAM